MGCCDKDDDDDEEKQGRKKGCCGKSPDERRRDIERDGCCDEDCCNRTCCFGRAACSLEAGFAATFAVLSFGAMLYANNTCNYVRLRGNAYYDQNSTDGGGGGGGGYSDHYTVAVMNRGIFFGQPVPSAACLSWISIERLDATNDFVYIDPWWYASMGCAAAASAFGFASFVQIVFVSCVPRKSQRYAARCASAMAIIAAVLEGCTLLYVNSSAVKDVRWPYNPDVDFTAFTLYISAWCAVASCGGWFITAFILCFLKNPPDPDDPDVVGAAAALSESNRSSRGSDKRGASAHEQDDEADEEEYLDEEDVVQENGPDSPASGAGAAAAAAGAAMGVAAVGIVATQSSDEAETDNEFEDAVTGSDLNQHRGRASEQARDQVVEENYSASPGWGYYRQSADDFVDG